MSLRPYQAAAVDFLAPIQRGFIVAPAGSGKTIIAASAAARVAQPLDLVVWLANTREQCDQASKAIARARWRDLVEIRVHCVAAQPDVSDADILIIDECHHLPAATWHATAGKAERVVWGFSATPWHRDEERNQKLREFFGDNFFTVNREEVIAGGHLAAGRVIFHDFDAIGEFEAGILDATEEDVAKQLNRFRHANREELYKRARWRFTAEAIRNNTNRNSVIVALANEAVGSVLVLVATIEHGEQLAAWIAGAVLVHAKIGKKKRAQAIEDFRSGQIRCMVATSLADEGLDVPRAAVLILASGGRSAGKIEQRAGRVLRPFEGKTCGLVHDFTDRGSAMGHAQARARSKVYRSLGYTVTTQLIQTKEVA